MADKANSADRGEGEGDPQPQYSGVAWTEPEQEHKLPSEDVLVKLYKEWDPMAEEDSSFLNTPRLNDASSLITGDDGRQLDNADIQCPFYDGSTDKCFKQKCSYKHDKLLAQALASENTQCIDALQKQAIPVLITSQLKPQQIATEGSMIVAKVTCVVNPSEFYVVPVSDWSCACEKASVHDCEEEHKDAGLENLTKMWTHLDYSATRNARHSNYYSRNELVAVKLETGDKTRQWFRAAVLEDTGIGETNEMPSVHLKLIDIGTVIHTSAKNVVPLTVEFLRWPALAFKCGIFGISPITHRWSRRAIEYFRTLVQEQTVLLEIKQPVRRNVADGDGKYLVSIRVKLNGKYVNVAHKMADEGLGLEWHPFPARPKVLGALPAEEARAFAELTKPFGQQGMPANPVLDEKVMKREIDRLERYELNSNSPNPR